MTLSELIMDLQELVNDGHGEAIVEPKTGSNWEGVVMGVSVGVRVLDDFEEKGVAVARSWYRDGGSKADLDALLRDLSALEKACQAMLTSVRHATVEVVYFRTCRLNKST